MGKEPIIEATGLSIGYNLRHRKQKVVHAGLNLSLYAGEVTCLLGLNGAGKSTLLRTLCGFQPPLSGSIHIMGKPLRSYSQSLFSRTIGVVLTEKTNAGGITVYELVSLGRHPYTGFFGQLTSHDHEIIEESIKRVGIAHKADNYVGELSDGERQKAMIAKTLAQQCPVIVLDEPTAFLDVTSRIETMVLLRRLAQEQNKTIILSTHDMESAIQMGDCLWLLAKDREMACGTPEDLILDGQFESFFSKEGIHFDSSTGKLSAVTTTIPMGVEGDFETAYWVGNALIRNGFKPAPVSNEYSNIYCQDPSHLILTKSSGEKVVAENVASLLEHLSI